MRGGAGPGRLRHRVGERIAELGLWAPGQSVAVAVSGGLDSTCLLDLLVETAGWHGGRLEVVTVDHGTREGSAADADRVEALAASRGLPCRRVSLALPPTTSEELLRSARYAAFDALPVDRVALGHHRRDQAETLLLQLLRGAGTDGLGGMRWIRDRYVRPLLDVDPTELRAWAAHRGLSSVEDPSNRDPAFLRNRVRHELLPLLEELRPGAVATLARSARVAADDAAWLEELLDRTEEARDRDGWSAAWVAAGPAPLVRRALSRAVPGLSAAQLDAVVRAARSGRGTVDLGDRRFVVSGGRVRHGPSPPTEDR